MRPSGWRCPASLQHAGVNATITQEYRGIYDDLSARSWRDSRGNISIVAAVVLTVLVGFAGLATEYGTALMTKSKTQPIADAAAYSGAMAYSASSSTTALNNAVSRIATTNGIPSSAAVASLVTSPTGDGNQAVNVTVTSSSPLGLSRILGTSNSVSVASTAYAEMKSSGASCVVGLASSGNSILADGGATVRGTNCAVAAKNNLSISGGASMTVLGVYTGGTATITGGASITTTPTANNIVQSYAGISDPVASNTALQAAFTGLSSLGGAVTTPFSSVSLTFNSSPSGPSDPTYPYYSTGGVYINKGTLLPCAALNSITVSGGVSVHISATPGCNYTIAHGINNGGSLLQIDGAVGSWSVNGGITTNGGSTTTLTANKYQVSGTINLVGTVNWLTTGASASVQFLGAVSLGSGGGTFTFGDGTYSVNGNLTLSSGPTYFGNTLLSINGNLSVGGGAKLCGVPAPCGSGTSKMTIVDNGTNSFNGGSTVNIAAPSVGATFGIPGIIIAGSYVNTTGYQQVFSGGTGGTFAGVMYFPNSNVELSGGSSTSGVNCFEIVANVIYMAGGATTASTCSGFGANVGPSVITLVQ
jgi:Flp pilus assembly protein TadG